MREMDDTTTLSQLKQLVEEFVFGRDSAQFHSPKNLSMVIAIETTKLMDLFKWPDALDTATMMERDEIALAAQEEIAEIMIYCLAFANRTGIDVSGAIERKVAKNGAKYPAGAFQGRY